MQANAQEIVATVVRAIAMYVPLDLLRRPSELFYLLGRHITESTESPEQTQALLREVRTATST